MTKGLAIIGCLVWLVAASDLTGQELIDSEGRSVRRLLGKDEQELVVPDQPSEPLSDGFEAPTEIVLLRAKMLEVDAETSAAAMQRLGRVAMDRVTAEMLKSITRTSDEERRFAAGRALVEIGERAARLGHREFAGTIGESLYLSAQADDVRDKAYRLFMLLDTERAERHRKLGRQ